MKKTNATESNTTAEARSTNDARAALTAAIAATTAARAAHAAALADLKTVRPKNVKQRQEAELLRLAELNQAEDDEAAARNALADAQRELDRVTMLAHATQADPVKARVALEQALAVALKHADELRAEFDALDAILTTQRTSAYLAKRIARENGWEADITALPRNLAEAMRLVAEHASGAPRVTWLPALENVPDVANAVLRTLRIELPTRLTHQFAAKVPPADQITLAIGGELGSLVKHWDAKVAADLSEGQARHAALIEEYRQASEQYAREHSEEARARLRVAKEAFKSKPEAATLDAQ